MSYKITEKVLDTKFPWVEVQDEGKNVLVKPTTLKIFLLCLAERANGKGADVFPGTGEIQERMQVDEATVRRCRKASERIGVIIYVGRSGAKYNWTKKYKFNLKALNSTYYSVVDRQYKGSTIQAYSGGTTEAYSGGTTGGEVNRPKRSGTRGGASASDLGSSAAPTNKKSYQWKVGDPIPEGFQAHNTDKGWALRAIPAHELKAQKDWDENNKYIETEKDDKEEN
jgi:hypothetical protein